MPSRKKNLRAGENPASVGPLEDPQEQSKKEGKDQESIQSSTGPDPGYQWESNKLTIRHHKREPRGQLALSQQVTTRQQ